MAENDSGVFELSFQSERYLPFEGAGAISTWRLELPQGYRQFDYQTITDVVIHLRYTSCEGGETLKTAALAHLNKYVANAAELSKNEGLFRMFSLPHEFPNEFHRLLNPEPNSENQILKLGNLKERFPFFVQSPQIITELADFRLYIPEEGMQMNLLHSQQAETLIENSIEDFQSGTPTETLYQYVITDMEEDLTGYWGIQFNTEESITKDQLKNAWLVIKYQISS